MKSHSLFDASDVTLANNSLKVIMTSKTDKDEFTNSLPDNLVIAIHLLSTAYPHSSKNPRNSYIAGFLECLLLFSFIYENSQVLKMTVEESEIDLDTLFESLNNQTKLDPQ